MRGSSAPFATCTRLADVPPTPWRNGGGTTRELAVFPPRSEGVEVPWQWRLSVADIASDGPFSNYAGVTRWFAVLGGAGVELTWGPPQSQRQRLMLGDAPICFDGASAPFAALLNGPTQDVNLMLQGVSGRLVAVCPGLPGQPGLAASQPEGLLAASPGRLTLDAEPQRVSDPSWIHFSSRAPKRATFDGTGWWVMIDKQP